MSTPEESIDQPQTYGDVPGWNDEGNDGVLPGWDGEGRDQERQQGFAATMVQLTKDQNMNLQNAINYLQSSYDARILERNDTVSKLAEENKGLRELFAEEQKLSLKLFEKWNGVYEQLKETERLLTRETEFVGEIDYNHNQTEVLLENTRKELNDTKEELRKCKAEKAATEVGEYAKSVNLGLNHLVSEIASLKKQLADREAGALLSTKPRSSIPGGRTPKSDHSSRPAWK